MPFTRTYARTRCQAQPPVEFSLHKVSELRCTLVQLAVHLTMPRAHGLTTLVRLCIVPVGGGGHAKVMPLLVACMNTGVPSLAQVTLFLDLFS